MMIPFTSTDKAMMTVMVVVLLLIAIIIWYNEQLGILQAPWNLMQPYQPYAPYPAGPMQDQNGYTISNQYPLL